jgi:hypothetical protein
MICFEKKQNLICFEKKHLISSGIRVGVSRYILIGKHYRLSSPSLLIFVAPTVVPVSTEERMDANLSKKQYPQHTPIKKRYFMPVWVNCSFIILHSSACFIFILLQ